MLVHASACQLHTGWLVKCCVTGTAEKCSDRNARVDQSSGRRATTLRTAQLDSQRFPGSTVHHNRQIRGSQQRCSSVAASLADTQWGIWALLAACGAAGQVRLKYLRQAATTGQLSLMLSRILTLPPGAGPAGPHPCGAAVFGTAAGPAAGTSSSLDWADASLTPRL